MKKTRRILFLVGGWVCVLLATIGIFVPVLPTTPFLLLASFCFARSSARLQNWLLTNRWFGEYINNYRQGKGMSLRHKVMTLLLLWATIGYAALAFSAWWLRGILLCVALAVSYHLIRIRTLTQRPGKWQMRKPTDEETA